MARFIFDLVSVFSRETEAAFHYLIAFTISLLVVAYTANITSGSGAESLDYDGETLDLAFDYRLDSPEADDRILILDVDERSLSTLAKQYGRWPWPRDAFAEILLSLSDAGAKAIALNILFSDPDLRNPDSDDLLNEVIAMVSVASPLVRLPTENDQLSSVTVSNIPGSRLSVPTNDPKIAVIIPTFEASHSSLGVNNLFLDEDGLVRRGGGYWLEKEFALPTLARTAVQLSGFSIAEHNENFVLNWRNKRQRHARISFIDALEAANKGGSYLSDLVRGKIIILGASAPGLAILKGSALGPNTDDNEILATTIDDLLNGTGLIPIQPWITAAISIFCLLLVAFLFSRNVGTDLVDLIFVLLQSASVGIVLLSISFSPIVFDLTMLIASVTALFTISRVFEYAVSSARCGKPPFQPIISETDRHVTVLFYDELDARGITRERKRLEKYFGDKKRIFEIPELINVGNFLAIGEVNFSYLCIFAAQEMSDKTLDHLNDEEISPEVVFKASWEREEEFQALMSRTTAALLSHAVSWINGSETTL